MTALSQIVAIEKGVKDKASRALTEAYKDAQKPQLFTGLARSYRPKDDEGDRLPPESTRVQLTVDQVIANASNELSRLFDVVATKDTTNASASADVVVDGVVLIPNLTVPTLLFLEKQLVDLRTFFSKLPTLDPSERWSYDPAASTFATEPVETTRTKKIPRNWVKAEATERHPAQVEVYHEDVVVGYWSTIKFSGALPADRVKELLDRVDKLLVAVKFARETANTTEVVDKKIGSAVFSYLLT